jgi:hypothetical protein
MSPGFRALLRAWVPLHQASAKAPGRLSRGLRRVSKGPPRPAPSPAGRAAVTEMRAKCRYTR